MIIKLSRVAPGFQDIPLPSYTTNGSAGMDIHAALHSSLEINPQQIVLVPTALSIELPEGFEAQIRSRSGLAAKYGIFALNSPGTVDSDYRGEIKIILANFGKDPFVINRGDRIAQMVVTQYERVEWEVVESLSDSERGKGGFGSTGGFRDNV